LSADPSQQILRVHRLAQESTDSEFIGHRPRFTGSESSHDDQWNVHAPPANFPQKIETTQARHVQVADDEIGFGETA
jgi:hypothetical protein